MDFFPYPFFQFDFEVIRCLRFFYIFWYHVVQFWSKVHLNQTTFWMFKGNKLEPLSWLDITILKCFCHNFSSKSPFWTFWWNERPGMSVAKPLWLLWLPIWKCLKLQRDSQKEPLSLLSTICSRINNRCNIAINNFHLQHCKWMVLGG